MIRAVIVVVVQRPKYDIQIKRGFTNWLKRLTPDLFKGPRRKRMEITNNNFAEKLPLIEASIEDSIFVAIDGEFTGLSCKSDSISGLDTPAERYLKTQKTASKFLLVQFGLCTFHYDHKKKIYSNRAFNFYVWPRPLSRAAPDPRFLCQASSIDFLTRQNFDFNKLFREGIPYLNSVDEKKLRDLADDKREIRRQSNQIFSPCTPSTSGHVPVPEDQRQFVDEIVEKVEKWNDSGSEKILHLDRCNPFQRKLVYQTLKSKYGQDLFMETVDKDKEKVIAISKTTAEEVEKRESERDRLELEELETAIGFSKVIKKISASQKLVVGHNMLLDLLFSINQFVTYLPESYMEFKLLMQTSFPRVCDTKLMASTPPFKEEIRNSSLEELLKTVSNSPYTIPEMVPDSTGGLAGYSLGETNEKYHEAGYDAFITGLCFIALSNRLGQMRDGKPSAILPDSPLVTPFYNKLHLMMSNDIPYMNLSGKDIEPIRDDVFHITFPQEWGHSDIQSLFFPFGGIFTYWLTDTTAFVRLRESVPNAKTIVPSTLNGSSLYNIMAYAQFKAIEATYGNTTGITPTLEKANLSFSSPYRFTPSPHRHPAARLPMRQTGLTKMVQQIHSEEESANGGGGGGLQPDPTMSGKKRSASPCPDNRKRNKSIEDKPKKVQTFDEPPWE